MAPIREQLDAQGVSVPLIGDFHFNGHKLLSNYPDCAQALAKYRINPGNVGRGKKRDEQFATMIETACRYDKPVRIGVNWGSLDQALVVRLMDENTARKNPKDSQAVIHDAMMTSALGNARSALEELGLRHDQIILSVKMSGVQDLIGVYRTLAEQCDYPLHLGLTEAGMGSQRHRCLDRRAYRCLLQEGIGDTIRISLTPEPGGDRTQEVIVAQEILQTMGLRAFTPTSSRLPRLRPHHQRLPSRQLAQDIQGYLRAADAGLAQTIPRGGRH